MMAVVALPAAAAAFQVVGDAIPAPLTDVADRLSAGQIRLRLVDPRVVNPDTVMPAYFSQEGLVRVGRAWQGRTALTAQQIEDAVAFLMTLKEE